MTRHPSLPQRLRRLSPLLLAALFTLPAHADERQEVEQLRAATLGLIEALVGQGLLSRERADALLKQAQAAKPAATWGAPLPPDQANAQQAGPGNVIRVPYVPESVKAQMREDIKNEVLSVAREERWADPRALPDWVRRVQVDGDIRVRWQGEHYAAPVLAPGAFSECDIVGGNLPASCYRTQTGSPAWAPDMTNTTNNRDRLTLRARLGVNAKVSDDTQAGIRITTGSTSGPTSSSQTLGTHFNKAGIVLDRAFLRYEPRYDFRVIAGRMPNPFFGTDLLWPDDLSFDGIAVQGEHNLGSGFYAFANAGVFPLEEFSVDKRDKWLYAAQVGADWSFGDSNSLRVALAMYDFAHVEGVRENDPAPSGALAGTVPYQTSQYPSSVRLKGNTLINLNDPTSTAAPVWGLASKFKPINLTAALTIKSFDPMELGVSLDWVKNSAFDMADIQRRAGTDAVTAVAAKTTGLQLKASFGRPHLADKGDWLVHAGYREFQRDAWIDGFTDTTWHLGGTNYKGWQVGGSYAFDRHSTLGLRLTSTRNLDDGTAQFSNAPLKIDVLQIDLNTRF